MALGAHFDGSAWTAADLTSFPPGTVSSDLDAVSCTPGSFPGQCTAGGLEKPAEGSIAAALERYNGSTWTDQPFAEEPPAQSSTMAGVTCHGPRGCVAVGEWEDSAPADHALIESARATTWSLETPSLPAAGATDETLASTACVATDPCVAVGAKTLSSMHNEPLVEEAFVGSGWGAASAPLPPAATSGQLFGVSCGSMGAASTCVSVGSMVTAAGIRPLGEVRNGGTWSPSLPPVPAGTAHAYLQGISCPSATSCTAVGAAIPAHSASEVPLVDTWNGHAWSLGSPAVPGGTSDSALLSVSCATASSCTAVGFAERGNQTLVEEWNGLSWSIHPVILPSGDTSASLGGVSCPSAARCVAVGIGRDGRGVSHALAVVVNGTTLTSQPAADPPGNLLSLPGVDCLSATNCTAVGSYRNATGQVVTLVEHYD